VGQRIIKGQTAAAEEEEEEEKDSVSREAFI
jgi:hypothetical protein